MTNHGSGMTKNSTMFTAIAVLATLLLAALAFIRHSLKGPMEMSTGRAATQPAPGRISEPPFGVAERVPWTTSKVVGSPEAPDPFLTERIFPKLTFNKPLDIAYAPGSNRVFVVQQEGKILSFPDDAKVEKADLLLDVTKLESLKDFPRSIGLNLYGLTFDPDYRTNHYCYICYVPAFPYRRAVDYAKAWPENKTAARVSRFTVSESDPPTIDSRSEQIIIAWPGGGHNGGCLKFGKDGNLLVSTGDNGDPNPPDPFSIGQEVGDLRSKILRIDVRKPSGDKLYSIPADNPFVNTPGARGEVFAYGLRNPWRFSVDSVTGDIWAGDVGWELWESIYHIVSGGNYGWSITEGPQPVYPKGKRGPTPIIPPDVALPHTESASVSGGCVYHGKKLPALAGQYIFGDWETRRLWAAPYDGKKLGKHRTIAQTDQRIVAFGEDAEGELTIVDHESGGLFRIAPNPKVGGERNFPHLLSASGLFTNVAKQIPSPGVVPFSINTPQWVDGSTSQHFIAVPGNGKIYDKPDDGKRIYPVNSVLVRTLSLPMVAGDECSSRKIETQLLHFDGRQWHGYSYQWNSSQTDAMLVGGNGNDILLTIFDGAAPGGKREQTWHFNSRAQCMTCHTTWTSYAIALSEQQIDRMEKYPAIDGGMTADNQLRTLRHLGLYPYPLPPKPRKDGTYPPPPQKWVLVNPYEDDGKHSLEDRARSWLHINCSVCHRKGGGGTALFDVTRSEGLGGNHLIFNPMLGTFGLPDADVICPGDPSRSVLFYRMAKSGTGRMPHLGSQVIDDRGLLLIGRWIESLRGKPFTPASAETRAQCAALDEATRVVQDGPGESCARAIAKLLESPQGALKLLLGLQEGRIAPSFAGTIAAKAAASPLDTVRDVFSRFAPEQAGAATKVGTNPQVDQLLALPGDAERGRKVFFELAGGLCSKCHIIANQGTDLGPNLSTIGQKYNKADLLDNILHPSKTIAQGYETYVIRTKAQGDKPAETYTGFLVSRSDTEVVLKDQERKLIHLRPADVDKMAMQPVSAMPEGIIADLQPQQAADLLEFLATRK
jgi:putative heme-binding domain-containing protein